MAQPRDSRANIVIKGFQAGTGLPGWEYHYAIARYPMRASDGAGEIEFDERRLKSDKAAKKRMRLIPHASRHSKAQHLLLLFAKESLEIFLKLRECLPESRCQQFTRIGRAGSSTFESQVLQVRHVDSVFNVRSRVAKQLVDKLKVFPHRRLVLAVDRGLCRSGPRGHLQVQQPVGASSMLAATLGNRSFSIAKKWERSIFSVINHVQYAIENRLT